MIGTLSTLATRVYGSTITASIRYGAVLARAGGRKSHSSSSSSSSYGSRGGGSIGGVVGGLVFLVLVAGVGYFVFQRMKSKDPAKAAAMAAGAAGFMAAGVALAKKVQEEAGKASSSGGGAGVAAIKAHDPAFDETAFLAGTEKQFFIIQKAWTDQDPDQSRQVMADGIWQTHRTQITDQQAKGVRSVMDDLAVNKASIVRADSSGGKDSVSVKFEARCRDYEVDAKTMKRKGGRQGHRSVDGDMDIPARRHRRDAGRCGHAVAEVPQLWGAAQSGLGRYMQILQGQRDGWRSGLGAGSDRRGVIAGRHSEAMASATAMVRWALATCRFSIMRPSTVTTPRPAASPSSNAAITLRAYSTSSGVGAQTSLAMST